MKKVFFIAAAALLLAGCQNDELATNGGGSSRPQITFGMGVPTATRAASTLTGKEAADRLGNNFIVEGFKYYGEEPVSELTDPTKQQEVFDYYNVIYTDGSAKTTQTNTTGWEYAGYLSPSGEEQTVKYWDYEASGYVFSAVSGTGITAKKIEATEAVSSVYDKGWYVNIPVGGSLADLYASARKPVAKPETGSSYDETVNLTFYSMVTKVRFAIYETVPGYKVSIDRFYYKGEDKWYKTADNFAISGNFRTLNADTETPVKVVYYDDRTAIENQPKVVVDENNVGKPVYMLFGTNIQAQDAIGTSSMNATYDQAGKEYTCVLPYAEADNSLTLYVDYTLTANNGETIHVKHASANVPANFTQWKENFAYTYIFKISEKTNGTTGNPGEPVDPDDPDDPTVDPDDPAGLYPITFDACVVDNQNGIQENITSVSEPSVTTYQNGEIVTLTNEYEAGDVYFTVMADMTLANLRDAAKVFEVNNYGAETTTEAVVQNWKNNFVILTPVDIEAATAVPATDGTDIVFADGYCYRFAARTGKLYAIQFTDAAGEETYKLVKVAGQDEKPLALSVTLSQDQTISSLSGAVICNVSNENGAGAVNGILGATPLIKIFDAAGNDVTTKFVVAEAGEGNYAFQVTEESVKSGANGTYSVKCSTSDAGNTFAVDMKYSLTKDKVTVVAGGTKDAVVLKYTPDAKALASADVICGVKGITVADAEANGEYTVAADKDVPFGTYTATIAGETLNIEVISYSFDQDEVVLTKKLEGTTQAALKLFRNGEVSEVDAASLTGADSEVATVTGAGEYTITAVKGGEFTLKYEASECKVMVNEYALTTDSPAVKRATGRSIISLLLNGKYANATTKNVTCTAQPEGGSYQLFTNGRDLVLANVTKAGDYSFNYTVNGVVVAAITITVE